MTLKFIQIESEPIKTKNAILILPALGIGNVAQLAMDVIIETSQAKRVARIESPALLPCVGVDPFSHASGPAYPLELFALSESDIYLLQQRSPAAPGRQKEFSKDLASFIQESGFSKVLLLGSLDGTFRRDAELSGSQLRYWASDTTLESSLSSAGIVALENEWFSDKPIEERLLPPWTILHELKEKNPGVGALLIFALEGNNIPEALHVVGASVKLVDGLKNALGEEAAMWKRPPSWQYIQA